MAVGMMDNFLTGTTVTVVGGEDEIVPKIVVSGLDM